MAKLAIIVLLAFVVGFQFFSIVKAEDAAPEAEEKAAAPEAEGEDRSAAYASASISLRPGAMRPVFPGPQPGLVQCYACVDCPRVYLNTTVKWCPRTMDPYKHSSCVTYAEQYKHLHKKWYIRGCATERGSCTDIIQAHSGTTDIVKLVFCNECEGDRCNGASRSITDITMAIFALIVTPLVAKVTLS